MVETMDIIEKYHEAKEAFENACRRDLEQAIKTQLEKLDDGESIPLNSTNCDGTGIAVREYSNVINKVNKDGSCIVYNNYDCEDSGNANHDADVFGFPLEVTVEILQCVRDYMKNRIQFTVEPCDIQKRIDNLKHDVKIIEKGFDNPNPVSSQEMDEEDFQISIKKELIKELETLIK